MTKLENVHIKIKQNFSLKQLTSSFAHQGKFKMIYDTLLQTMQRRFRK